ncbi:Uncharacterized protein TCM_041247 [Theobroma cacao]|uniref:Uncharacterized protein n=1 Tax=Theobroma cacao TaxID=3641 RepID=A0A061GUY3_THECC|nr:Uncharacterized protein TCM_041247 [Theobroma cacao]
MPREGAALRPSNQLNMRDEGITITDSPLIMTILRGQTVQAQCYQRGKVVHPWSDTGIVLGIVVLAPFLLSDQGDAITKAITELLSPVDLLLLPIILLLTIRFLSSDRGSFISNIFSTGEPDSIHRVSGSPFGVALFLVAPQTQGSSLPHTTFPSLAVMMTSIFDSASI